MRNTETREGQIPPDDLKVFVETRFDEKPSRGIS